MPYIVAGTNVKLKQNVELRASFNVNDFYVLSTLAYVASPNNIVDVALLLPNDSKGKLESLGSVLTEDRIESWRTATSTYRRQFASDLERYKNRYYTWLSIEDVIIDPKDDGHRCKVCWEFVPMAVANQTDGTFVCYGCRSNPLRRYY